MTILFSRCMEVYLQIVTKIANVSTFQSVISFRTLSKKVSKEAGVSFVRGWWSSKAQSVDIWYQATVSNQTIQELTLTLKFHVYCYLISSLKYKCNNVTQAMTWHSFTDLHVCFACSWISAAVFVDVVGSP